MNQENITTSQKNQTKKKDWILSFVYLGISLLLALYIIFIVTPIGNEGNFYSEGISSNESMRFSYFMMTVPVFIGYVIFSCINNIFHIKYIRFLNYPLTVLNYVLLLLESVANLSSVYFWLIMIPLAIAIYSIPVFFILGIIADFQQLSSEKKDKK